MTAPMALVSRVFRVCAVTKGMSARGITQSQRTAAQQPQTLYCIVVCMLGTKLRSCLQEGQGLGLESGGGSKFAESMTMIRL